MIDDEHLSSLWRLGSSLKLKVKLIRYQLERFVKRFWFLFLLLFLFVFLWWFFSWLSL
jgi:hypothetical protein